MRAPERWLAAGLLLWVVGVQSVEALASAGIAICFLGLWAHALRGPAEAGSSGWRGFVAEHLPLLLFLAWALLAPAMAGRWPTGTGVARLADWLAIPVGARALVLVGKKWRERVAIATGATLGLSCALAAMQHFGLWPSPELFEPLAWTRFPFHRVYEPAPGAEGRFMAGGLLSHRLKFAHVGGLVVLFALAAGLRCQGRRRVAALALAGVGLVSVLVFPVARMAAVALLLAVAFTLAWAHPRRRVGMALAAGLLPLGALVLALDVPLRVRLLAAATAEGSGDRVELLASGLRAVERYPIAGVGAGQFRPSRFAADSAPQHVRDNAGKAHNQLLSIAAEAGIPGLLLFLWVLAWLARRVGPPGLAGLLYFLLVSTSHDPLFQAQFSMALALCMGAGLAWTYLESRS